MNWLELLLSLFFAMGCAPLAFFFPGCICCGTDNCTIASDDFTTDNLATDWDIRSGSPTVSGGKLNASGTDLLIHNTAAGASATAVYATVQFIPSSTSDKGRLIIAYVDDSNYWFCEGQPGVTDGTLKLFERSGGTNTQRGSTATITGWTAASGRKLILCYADGVIRANSTTNIFADGGNGTVEYLTTITIASTKAGIGADETGAITFDAFSFEKHKFELSSCRSCSFCGFCDAGIMPDTVQVEVSGLTSGTTSNCIPCCTDLNAVYILQRVSECCWTTTFVQQCANNSFCNMDNAILNVTLGELRFEMGGGISGCGVTGDDLKFRQSSPSTSDCTAWANEEIPINIIGTTNACSGAGAAAYLTAL